MWRCLAVIALLSWSETASACDGTVGNYDYKPPAAPYSGDKKVSYFIGRIEKYIPPESDKDALRVIVTNIEADTSKAKHSGQKAYDYVLEDAGCAGVNIHNGMVGVFATYSENGVQFLAGWPGSW